MFSCNDFGWLRSSVFIAIFSNTSSRLHPRVPSGLCSLHFFYFDSKITPQCMYRGRWWIGKITVFKKGRKIHFSFDFCSTSSLSTITFWSKLRWLGHIFRKPPTRYFGDSPDNDFEPCSSTPVRGTTTFRGRPSVNWRQVRCKIHRFSRKARREVMDLAQDRRSYHQSIERQCSR